jgi:hypothetical protein
MVNETEFPQPLMRSGCDHLGDGPRSTAPGLAVARFVSVRALGFEQAGAAQPPVVMDAVDCVSLQLELTHDRGRESVPPARGSAKSDRRPAGATLVIVH